MTKLYMRIELRPTTFATTSPGKQTTSFTPVSPKWPASPFLPLLPTQDRPEKVNYPKSPKYDAPFLLGHLQLLQQPAKAFTFFQVQSLSVPCLTLLSEEQKWW